MEHEYSIRRSNASDIDRIMNVYDVAKEFMRRNGNYSQWTGTYPNRQTILSDIKHGDHYLAEDEDGNLLMVFSFIIGEDPTYKVIEDGSWLNDEPYGTIHRIATNGRRGGMLKACVDFCNGITDNIRIDTHEDNNPMLNALSKLDFKYCGTIYIADGSPRLAFQKDFRNRGINEIDVCHYN